MITRVLEIADIAFYFHLVNTKTLGFKKLSELKKKKKGWKKEGGKLVSCKKGRKKRREDGRGREGKRKGRSGKDRGRKPSSCVSIHHLPAGRPGPETGWMS